MYAGLQEWINAQFSPFTDEPDYALAPPIYQGGIYLI